jgi:CTP synthase
VLKDTKIIVIFGGVYSSLGKGICASSICRILREIGNNVTMMKLEPYLNVDPGLMSPYQHGEVYVTYDGGETDLDLGSYERIGGCNISKKQYLTSGFVYNEIITQERNGEYNGKTVQVVPHVTGKIKEKIFNVISSSKEHLDFLIIEVGGTVGDLESLAMVESLCEIQKEVGKENFLPILLAPLIHLQGTSGELKTKPAQHAYRELYKLGIVAEMMILRTDCDITEDVLTKMSFHCHIPNDFVFSAKTLSNVYFLPENFYEQKIHESIYKYFKLKLSKTTNINN